jgi:AcrR family transcriptional regulator/DNA-binding MarR family transcriptional regulator
MAPDVKALSMSVTPTLPAPVGDGYAREHVGEIQRTRILLAMAEVACERGAGDASVVHVVERAGVSRRTFYELFEDREDCLLAAIDAAITRARWYVSTEYDPTVGWAERIRCALTAALRFFEHEPAFGSLLIVESAGAGGKARGMRDTTFASLVAAVDEGDEGSGNASSGMLTAEGVVGGVASVIYGRLVSGERKRLVELVNPLMSMIVLPYLGPAAARREMEWPAPEARRQYTVTPANPLKGLEMRLTYRTVRVMAAIAANRGASNRVIGDASGVGDQGQISKLLARLQRLGLVENARADPSKGAPNVWMLTKQGEEVADVIVTGGARS